MTVKIAVSLPDEQVTAAKQLVSEGKAASVSALVSEALSEKLHADTLAAVVADIIAEVGPPAEADYDWARQALGL